MEWELLLSDDGNEGGRRMDSGANCAAHRPTDRPFEKAVSSQKRGKNAHGFVIFPGRGKGDGSSFAKKRRREIVSADYV